MSHTPNPAATSAAVAAPALRHPVVELLARYRAVLGAAWAARHDLAGTLARTDGGKIRTERKASKAPALV